MKKFTYNQQNEIISGEVHVESKSVVALLINGAIVHRVRSEVFDTESECRDRMQEVSGLNNTIRELINDGALFVINHSGGKDSQAMTAKLRSMIPPSQLHIIHAHLPGVEWEGTEEQVRRYSRDIPVSVVQSGKTFFEMVEHRKMFPSPTHRQCTSDLKRCPIEKEIRKIMRERGFTKVVNCMGLRSQESPARAKAVEFKWSEKNSKAGRTWFDWLPIHDMTLQDVWKTIADAGEQPHWVYAKGMSRLSCVFCIMSNNSDLRIASQLNPELFNKYVETEKRLGFSFIMPKKNQSPRHLDEIVRDISPETEETSTTICSSL